MNRWPPVSNRALVIILLLLAVTVALCLIFGPAPQTSPSTPPVDWKSR